MLRAEYDRVDCHSTSSYAASPYQRTNSKLASELAQRQTDIPRPQQCSQSLIQGPTEMIRAMLLRSKIVNAMQFSPLTAMR